jgi:hypothetical protein
MKKMKGSSKIVNSKAGTTNVGGKVNSGITQAQQTHNLHMRPKTQINGQRGTVSRTNIESRASNQNSNHPSGLESGANKHNSSFVHKGSQQQTSNLTPNSVPKFRDERVINSKVNNQQLLEAKVKRSTQRPYSGGIQKIMKTETSKSRV